MVKKLKHVLLIDDEAVDRMIYQRVIERSEMVERLLCIEDAAEALEYIEQQKLENTTVDAIFLDINMPRMNGFQFLDEARVRFGEQLLGTSVFMLSTSINPKDIERVKRIAAVKNYMQKPLTVEHIADVAEALLSEQGI